MKDGETYYAIVRATNVIGLTLIQRSDGITVQREPLIPGRVYDGPLIGKDLNYQLSLTSLSASWNGFGGDAVAGTVIEHTGLYILLLVSHSAAPSKNAVSAFHFSCKRLSFTLEDS